MESSYGDRIQRFTGIFELSYRDYLQEECCNGDDPNHEIEKLMKTGRIVAAKVPEGDSRRSYYYLTPAAVHEFGFPEHVAKPPSAEQFQLSTYLLPFCLRNGQRRVRAHWTHVQQLYPELGASNHKAYVFEETGEHTSRILEVHFLKGPKALPTLTKRLAALCEIPSIATDIRSGDFGLGIMTVIPSAFDTEPKFIELTQKIHVSLGQVPTQHTPRGKSHETATTAASVSAELYRATARDGL